MKYTYKISEHANSEVFAALKRDIEYLYPEFPFEKEIKDADGSRTDFFRCAQTGESIAAELSYANNNIVVTSDVCMVELADKYKEQLSVYRRCLAEVIGLPVKQTVIYSFKLGEIEV